MRQNKKGGKPLGEKACPKEHMSRHLVLAPIISLVENKQKSRGFFLLVRIRLCRGATGAHQKVFIQAEGRALPNAHLCHVTQRLCSPFFLLCITSLGKIKAINLSLFFRKGVRLLNEKERLENLLRSLLREQRAIDQQFVDVIVRSIEKLAESVGPKLAREVWQAIERDLREWDRKRKEKKGKGEVSEHIT